MSDLTMRQGLEAVRDWHSGDASELGCRTVAFVGALIEMLDDPKNYWNSNYKILWDNPDKPEPDGA